MLSVQSGKYLARTLLTDGVLYGCTIYYQEKSFDEIEKLLFVSFRSARRYVALFYETGEVSPVSQQHGPPRTLDSFEEMTLIQSLLNKPDMYLEELRQELLQVTGVEVSLSTVCRTLKREDFSRKRLRHKQGVTFASTSSTSTTTSSANPDPQVNRAKERVIGSRKIWGTLKSTTTAAVSSTLAKLTSVQPETQVQVKRKYKLSDKKTVRWWFVVRGTEEVLTKIENEWERVSLQTNWKMEPVLRFQSAVDSAESQSAADSAESQSATVSAESQSATVSAESPSETTSQPFLGEV